MTNVTLRYRLIAPIFTSTEQEQLERLREVCLQSLALALPSSKDCNTVSLGQPFAGRTRRRKIGDSFAAALRAHRLLTKLLLPKTSAIQY